MYVIEILVYSFGFLKKQREEEIYSRDFYSSFTSPRRFGFLSTTRFPERTRSQRERLRSHIALEIRKSAIKMHINIFLIFSPQEILILAIEECHSTLEIS